MSKTILSLANYTVFAFLLTVVDSCGEGIVRGQIDCVPDCGTRVCGPVPNGCGQSCGTCKEMEVCNAVAGSCEACTPVCADRVCGPVPNGCGESCGACEDPKSCNISSGRCDNRPATGTTINPDKTLSINGVKTFPQLMYYLCSHTVATANTCLNNLQANRDYYDANYLTWETEFIPYHEQAGMNFITFASGGTGYQNNSHFFGYIQPDEPISTGKDITALNQVYDNIKSTDPNHIVIADDWQSIGRMIEMADVLSIDIYPYKTSFAKDVGRNNILYIYELAIHNSISPHTNFDSISKPVWQIISANGVATDDFGLFRLTGAELRAWVFAAITMDFKGLEYFSYTRVGPNVFQGLFLDPNEIQIYHNQATEIKSLNDILVLPTKDYRWQFRTGTHVTFSNTLVGTWGYCNFNYMLKQKENDSYLIVVNKDSRPLADVGITISGLTGAMTATTLGTQTMGSSRSGRTLPVTNGQFVDSFDGHAAHIYRIW